MSEGIYKRTITRAGCTVEVKYTYPTRFGEGLTRSNRKVPNGTSEEVRIYNYELAVNKLTLILNENFTPDDWFITFHYEEHNRPDSIEAAKKQLSAFIRRIKKLYEDRSLSCKWVKTTSVGSKGAVHHHLTLPKGVSQAEISKLWKSVVKATPKARPPECRALYSTGEYSALAAYFCQQSEKGGEKEKNARMFTCSRNCARPQPEREERVNKIKWKEPPVAWTGYYIETDSIRAGCNPVTGKPYLFYRMVKLPADFVCYDDKGRRLAGKAAVKYYREHNKKFIIQNWLDLNPDGEVIFKADFERQNE